MGRAGGLQVSRDVRLALVDRDDDRHLLLAQEGRDVLVERRAAHLPVVEGDVMAAVVGTGSGCEAVAVAGASQVGPVAGRPGLRAATAPLVGGMQPTCPSTTITATSASPSAARACWRICGRKTSSGSSSKTCAGKASG